MITQQKTNTDYIPQQSPNWNKHHISGIDLQQEVTKTKFKLWDEADKTTGEAYKLLKDPTIYEYAFFKDDDGKPFRYEAYQDLIINEANKYNFQPDDPNRYLIFQASNQIGKSRGLRGYARFLINNKENINIVFISNNLKASQFLLSELRKEYNNSKFADSWKTEIGGTDNTTMITFERIVTDKDTGIKRKILNRIICAPAGEGALGYPIHYLFLDEADFYEDGKRLFWKVFFPRTKKTKGQIILFSNPNPDISPNESILEELWKGDLFIKKFHFNFLDASWNTKEEFERDRRNSPEHIFASTHLGERSDLSGSFFNQLELHNMLRKDWTNSLPTPPQGKPVFIGLDLGKMHDNTVFAIGTTTPDKESKYDNLDVQYIEILPLKTAYDKILDRLQEILDFYTERDITVQATGYDATGQKTFEDFLIKAGIHAVPVDFAKKETNKTRLYNDFKLLAEQAKIKIVYSQETEKQLSGLHFKYTGNKTLKVAHKTESIHDDIPDAIAILAHVAVTPHRIPVTASYVKHFSQENLTDEERTQKLQENIQKRMETQQERIIKQNNYKPKSLYNSYSNYY